MIVGMSLEGVLRTEQRAPIPMNLFLYKAMTATFQVWILTDSSAEEAEHWLRTRGMRDHAGVLGADVPRRQDVLRVDQIDTLRSHGQVAFVLDPDPAMARMCLSKGIPSLLYAHPRYSRPEFRPDAPKGVRRWEDIEAEIDHQQRMALEDGRLGEQQDRRFE